MNIHEYQAKALLKKYGVAVPVGYVAFTADEAVAAATKLKAEVNSPVFVVKAQIHAGGRGKAGGVKVVKSEAEVGEVAKTLLGKILVTHQTGPAGKEVGRLYIEQGIDIKRELYLGLLVDRAKSQICIMASTEGGMEIEEVAHSHPEKILKVWVDPTSGLFPYHARQLAYQLGLQGDQIKSFSKFVSALYKAFIELDGAIVEINPLVVTGDGSVMALDAKVNFDDNALYRHPEVVELRDLSEEDPAEVEASKYDLSYVKLDGTIGCMVNGAGLAMATMDIIKLYGAEPANFLDVGGGATKEKVTGAFKIILSDPNVNGILVNIFGGIMRCDIIAEGIIAAAKEMAIKVPLVVRLSGTKFEEGKKLLADSGLNIIPASTLAEAAEKVVAAVKKIAA